MERYEEKLKLYFRDQSIKKDPKYSEIFKEYGIPSYMRDWMIKRFVGEDEEVGEDEIREMFSLMKEKIAIKGGEEFVKRLKKKLNDGEAVQILTEIEVDADLKTGKYYFRLPLINFPSQKGLGVMSDSLVDKYEDELLKDKTWGVVTLRLVDQGEKRIVLCEDFKPFKPYRVDLEYFTKAREMFTTNEWIDIVVSAMDYNPGAFRMDQKLWLIVRLFPFVEKNYNLIELAPKGTGKSYVYSRLSKYGWMISGGVITRAKLFYDMASGRPGVVTKYDYIAIDEVQSVKLREPLEMVGVLKDYLESGSFRIGNYPGTGEAGLVILGNVPKEYQDVTKSFLRFLPEYFRETAFLDRFHAFLPGWLIPRMRENFKVNGWALNTEYFTEILHLLRYEIAYGNVVGELLKYPPDSDTRDVRAVRKSLTACLKILFPHVKELDFMKDREFEDFKRYCFKNATDLRQYVRYQMALVDPEYGKPIPKFILKNEK